MDALNPKVWAEMVVELFGPRLGRLLNQTAMLFLILGAIGIGGNWFFIGFVGDVLWPVATQIFGVPESGISLDNIEAIILVLVAAVSFFVIVFSLFVLLAIRTLRRRVIPQESIDQLAELRSEGIKILNRRPTDDSDLSQWEDGWREWAEKVVAFLKDNFTKAEQLSFTRLGLVPELPWGETPINAKHGHSLNMLAKQLLIIESMIETHQGRH